MNKELEEAVEVLNLWNKAEEFVINESTHYDKTPYIQRKQAIETVLTALENSIPNQVIEKKQEKLKNQYNKAVNHEGELIDNLINFQRISAKLELIQELLEGK